jgi:energy-coupling factor transporter transmembrane protein EcfT
MAGKLKPARRGPFAYRPGKTFLHRTPATVKLIMVMILSAVAFASVPGLALAILLVLAVSAAARIPFWELLKGAKPLLLLSLCIVLFKTFEQGEGITTPEIIIFNIYIPDVYIPNISAHGFYDGIIVALRILVTFAAAALLFAVTTMRELRLSLAAFEIRMKNLFTAKHPHRETSAFFSLGLCLMLGFIPRFFDLWETANLACEARSCKRSPRRLLILLPLVCEQMMEAAADTALALEARGLDLSL